MDAANPAARAPHAFLELGDDTLHVLVPRLLLLDRNGPANPFVARQRRDVLPRSKRFCISSEGFPEVGWQLMRDAARYLTFVYHISIVIQNSSHSYALR